MTDEKAREVLGDVRAYLASRSSLENEMLAGYTFTDICNAIKLLEQQPLHGYKIDMFTPIAQAWLSTFNTDSATECFTAVQELKKRLEDDADAKLD